MATLSKAVLALKELFVDPAQAAHTTPNTTPERAATPQTTGNGTSSPVSSPVKMSVGKRSSYSSATLTPSQAKRFLAARNHGRTSSADIDAFVVAEASIASSASPATKSRQAVVTSDMFKA